MVTSTGRTTSPSFGSIKIQQTSEITSNRRSKIMIKSQEGADKKWRLVKLRQKGQDSKLGFSLRGGKEATGSSVGVFVSHVERFGEADKKGLKVGDRLMELNGLDVNQATYDQVIAIIKRTPTAREILLKVRNLGKIPFQDKSGEPIRWLQVDTCELATDCQEEAFELKAEEDDEPVLELELEEQSRRKLASLASNGSSSTSSDDGIESFGNNNNNNYNNNSISSTTTKGLGPSKAGQTDDSAVGTSYADSLSDCSSNGELGSCCSSASNISISSLQTSSSSGDSIDEPVLVRVPGGRRTSESFGCGVVKGLDQWPGIFVQNVKPGSLAERVGLELGDQLVMADNRPLDELSFEAAIKLIKGLQTDQDELLLHVRKGAALKHLAATNRKLAPARQAVAGAPERARQPMASARQTTSGRNEVNKSGDNPISGIKSQASGSQVGLRMESRLCDRSRSMPEPASMEMATSGRREPPPAPPPSLPIGAKWSGAARRNQKATNSTTPTTAASFSTPSEGAEEDISANNRQQLTKRALCQRSHGDEKVDSNGVADLIATTTKASNASPSETADCCSSASPREDNNEPPKASVGRQAVGADRRTDSLIKTIQHQGSRDVDEMNRKQEEEEEEEAEEIRIVSQNCRLHQSSCGLQARRQPQKQKMLAATNQAIQQSNKSQQVASTESVYSPNENVGRSRPAFREASASRKLTANNCKQRVVLSDARYVSVDNLSICTSRNNKQIDGPIEKGLRSSSTIRHQSDYSPYAENQHYSSRLNQEPVTMRERQLYRRSNSVMGGLNTVAGVCCTPVGSHFRPLPSNPPVATRLLKTTNFTAEVCKCCIDSRQQNLVYASQRQMLLMQRQQTGQGAMLRSKARSMDKLNMNINLNYVKIGLNRNSRPISNNLRNRLMVQPALRGTSTCCGVQLLPNQQEQQQQQQNVFNYATASGMISSRMSSCCSSRNRPSRTLLPPCNVTSGYQEKFYHKAAATCKGSERATRRAGPVSGYGTASCCSGISYQTTSCCSSLLVPMQPDAYQYQANMTTGNKKVVCVAATGRYNLVGVKNGLASDSSGYVSSREHPLSGQQAEGKCRLLKLCPVPVQLPNNQLLKIPQPPAPPPAPPLPSHGRGGPSNSRQQRQTLTTFLSGSSASHQNLQQNLHLLEAEPEVNKNDNISPSTSSAYDSLSPNSVSSLTTRTTSNSNSSLDCSSSSEEMIGCSRKLPVEKRVVGGGKQLKKNPQQPPCPPPMPANYDDIPSSLPACGQQTKPSQQSASIKKQKPPALCFVDELKMFASRHSIVGEQRATSPTSSTEVDLPASGGGGGGGSGKGREVDSSTLIKIINASKSTIRCSCRNINIKLADNNSVCSGTCAHSSQTSQRKESKSVKLDEENNKRRQHEMLMKEFKTAHSKMFSKRRAAQGEQYGENSPNRLDPNTESDHQTSSNGFSRDRQQPEVERVRL